MECLDIRKVFDTGFYLYTNLGSGNPDLFVSNKTRLLSRRLSLSCWI